MSFRRLLLALPLAFGVAAALAAAPDAAPSDGEVAAPDTRLPVHPNLRSLDPRVLADDPGGAPDALNPIVKGVHGPFRENLSGHDASQDPTPAYTEEERRQLVEGQHDQIRRR